MKRVLLFLVVAAVAGCVGAPREAGVAGEDARDAEVIMRLYAPGGFDTRALTDEQQSAVEDIYVLAFAGGELKHIREGELAAGRRAFSINLREGTFDLTVLANATDIIENSGIEEGDTYDEVAAALRGEMAGKYDGETLPMWGEVDDVEVSTTAANEHTTVLTRALARVDVGLGNFEEGVWSGFEDDFELQEVLVFKPNDRYALMPGDAAPTIPAATQALAQPLSYAVPDGRLTSADIYIAESAVASTAMEQRTAIVVGGSFGGGTTTWYRLDFVVGGELKDIVRNHLYRFRILSVTGDGYSTPAEAYEAGAVNIKFDIEEWNESDIDEVFMDGPLFFGISGRKVVFTPFGNQSETLTIRTNIPDFSLKMGEQKLDVEGTVSTPNFNYSLEKIDSEHYKLHIFCPGHNVSDAVREKSERWDILAARITMPLTVDQQWTSLYISIQDGQSSQFFPEGGTLPVDIISPMPVTVSSSGAWVGGVQNVTTTDDDGLYVASLELAVPVYAAGQSDRMAAIIITPQGEDPVAHSIIQEAPYLSVVPPTYLLNRPATAKVETVPFDVITNLPAADLALSGGTAYIKNTASGLHNIDALHPRYLRFDTETDFTTAVPATAFDATFTITPDPKYGLPNASAMVSVAVAPNPPEPEPPYILYWDTQSQTMALGSWEDVTGGKVTQSNMLFFQFGSIVGFTNNDAWSSDDIKFNPTPITAYESLPIWDGGSIEDGYISSSAYHTEANVKAGRGDPCKIVGLTVADIAAGKYDNGKYRLPTDAENAATYGSGTQFVGTRESSGYGVRIGTDNSTMLPAAGRRTASGLTSNVYNIGYYWSSRPYSDTNGYYLYFDTSVNPGNYLNARNGSAVRCVPDLPPPPPEPEPPYILYWDAPSQTMALGSWNEVTGGAVTQQNMLYFQFGSVVGFTASSNSDTWSVDDVKFNPPRTTYAATQAGYQSIPNWNGSSTEDGYISSSAYHNEANVKAGRGDPCKLVGLKLSDIAEGNYDNGKYRLPTDTENEAQYGSAAMVGSAGTSGRGLRLGSDIYTFLPAAGNRSTNGQQYDVYTSGLYWSGTPRNASIGRYHVFGTTVGDLSGLTARHGFPMRCVPQDFALPPPPDPAAPYILYLDDESQALSAGRWDNDNIRTDNMMFFKFGSVIGFNHPVDYPAGIWPTDGSAIRFNPTPLRWGTNITAYDGESSGHAGTNALPFIPGYTRFDRPKNVTSDDGYVTVANLKAGRGDPCMLVGYTAVQLQAMSDAELQSVIDNAPYRLPSHAENVDFVGSTSNWASRWNANGGNSQNPATATFTATFTAFVLPAAGYHSDTSGHRSTTGSRGMYWSSTDLSGGINAGAHGHVFFIDSNTATLTSGWYSTGFTVRCVEKVPSLPPVPDPPVIVNEKAPYLLYMNNGKLDLGRWKGIDPNGAVTQANLVFSKYGSVVGLTNDGSAYNHQGMVIFEPSTTPSTTFANIPGWINYSGSKPGGQEGYLSSASYHNDANLANGRGDICKLVGLTTEQAKALAAAEMLDEYDSGFRLPTLKENVDFTNTPTAAYTAISPVYNDNNLKFWDSGNKGFWFPIPGDRNATTGRTLRNNNPAGFLPATGNRTKLGASAQIGMLGTYWSSMSPATGYFCGLEMNALGSPAGFSPAFYELSGVESAATVRCVPKTGQEIPPPIPTEPYILYWDEVSRTMALRAWGSGVTQANMVFAQFGSTVGFLNNNNAWATNGSQVVFNPTSKTNATMGGAYATAIPSWYNYTGTKPATYTPADDGYISAASYHTRDNVLAGLGDICKLAGLTAEQVKAGTVDNKKYRLPTDAENNTDYGSGTQFIGTQGTSGRGLQKTGNTATFLPAAGRRETSGATLRVYDFGYYWSSRPYSAAGGYLLSFSTSVSPSDNGDARYGFAVRCVPQ